MCSRLLDFYLTQYKHGFMIHHVDLTWKKIGVLDMMIDRTHYHNCVLRHLCKGSLYLVCIFIFLASSFPKYYQLENNFSLFPIVCFWFVFLHFVFYPMLFTYEDFPFLPLKLCSFCLEMSTAVCSTQPRKV